MSRQERRRRIAKKKRLEQRHVTDEVKLTLFGSVAPKRKRKHSGEHNNMTDDPTPTRPSTLPLKEAPPGVIDRTAEDLLREGQELNRNTPTAAQINDANRKQWNRT